MNADLAKGKCDLTLSMALPSCSRRTASPPHEQNDWQQHSGCPWWDATQGDAAKISTLYTRSCSSTRLSARVPSFLPAKLGTFHPSMQEQPAKMMQHRPRAGCAAGRSPPQCNAASGTQASKSRPCPAGSYLNSCPRCAGPHERAVRTVGCATPLLVEGQHSKGAASRNMRQRSLLVARDAAICASRYCCNSKDR